MRLNEEAARHYRVWFWFRLHIKCKRIYPVGPAHKPASYHQCLMCKKRHSFWHRDTKLFSVITQKVIEVNETDLELDTEKNLHLHISSPECRTENNITTLNIPLKIIKFPISWNNCNKSKLQSSRNYEKSNGCYTADHSILFYSAFPSAMKYKIKIYRSNCACYFVCVWNLGRWNLSGN
jgi:hypothetical protein